MHPVNRESSSSITSCACRGATSYTAWIKQSFSDDRAHLVPICSLNLLTDTLYYTLNTYFIFMEWKQSWSIVACMPIKITIKQFCCSIFSLQCHILISCMLTRSCWHSVNAVRNSAHLGSTAAGNLKLSNQYYLRGCQQKAQLAHLKIEMTFD